MPLAFCIAAHKYPAQVKRFIQAIYSPEHCYFIHYDRKAPREEYDVLVEAFSGKPGIEFVPRRSIYWGCFTLPRLQLSTMDRALQSPVPWTHFLTLTGQDFPLQPLAAIERFFEGHPEESFLSWFEAFDGTWNNTKERLQRYYFTSPTISRVYRRFGRSLRPAIGTLSGIASVPFVKRRLRDRSYYYGGSNHICLSREAVQYMRKERAAKEIISHLRWSASSDEVIFQTALCNSPLKDRLVNDDLRDIQFEAHHPHPKTLTSEDEERLLASSKLFARKFDPNHSAAVLDALEARL